MTGQEGNRHGWRRAIGRAGLWCFFGLFVAAFSFRALYRRGRGTHTLGVGARGRFRAVADPAYPRCEFFAPGQEYPVHIRHATALRTDEAAKDFRSIAIKFSDQLFESPLDLVMNTGPAQGFWHAPNFLLGMIGGALGAFGRRLYIRLQPPAFENVNAGIRRAPESFAGMHYYSALSFQYLAQDGKPRLCRFRIVPAEGGEEAGLPDAADRAVPWREKRRPDETKSPDHLRREYTNRLERGQVVRYRLQIQTHEWASEDSNDIYNIGRAWPEECHPWCEVGVLEIDEPLPAKLTESLRFRITHQPPELGIPEADGPFDYRSIGWLRTRIYPCLQAWRHALRGLRRWTGLAADVAWDKPHAREAARFRKPQTRTFLVPVSRKRAGAVEAYLQRTHERWFANLGSVPGLHYLRAFVIGAEPDCTLAIDLVYDGELRDHLDDLAENSGGLWTGLLRAAGAPSGAAHERREWLLGFGETPAAFYIGGVRTSRRTIEEDHALRRRLHEILDTREAELRPRRCEAIRQTLRTAVLADGRSDLPSAAGAPGLRLARLKKLGDMALALANPVSGLLMRDVWKWALARESRGIRWLLVLPLSLWTLYTALPTGAMLLLIRFLERVEPVPPETQPSPEMLRRLEAHENLRLQNNLTMYAPMRDSLLRRWIMRVILHGAERGARHLWAEGRLTGIDTIHFARFHLLDGGRSMLFLSDFDGSWSRYLGDFLTVGSRAVVPIWSNLEGCPKTSWLFHPTPGFGGRFMRFTRSRQIEPLLWYSAYPNLSMANILGNTALREGLFAESMSEAAAREWLALLHR